MILIKFQIVCILIVALNCTIKVLNLPKSMEIEFKDNIKYTIANFGNIPYGSVSRAPLRMAKPETACQEITNDKDFQNTLPFLLILRGDCSFTTKVKNAAKHGAKLAIIMDNIIESTQYITMGDDGQGDEILIPSILISKQDGEKMIDIIKQKAIQDLQKKEEIELEIDFKLPQEKRVDLRLYINPPKRENYHLIFGIEERYDMVEGQIILNPVYELYQVPQKEFKQKPELSESCIQNGLYCAMDIDGDMPGKGKDVAEEYLFQICVQIVHGDRKWFSYLKQQYLDCYQITAFEKCRAQIGKVLSLNMSEIKTCMDGDPEDTVFPIHSMQLTYREANYLTKSSSGFPSLMINEILYRGSLGGDDVMEAICAGIQNPSEKCIALINKSVAKFERESILDKKGDGEEKSKSESNSEGDGEEKSKSESNSESDGEEETSNSENEKNQEGDGESEKGNNNSDNQGGNTNEGGNQNGTNETSNGEKSESNIDSEDEEFNSGSEDEYHQDIFKTIHKGHGRN